jgi:hypothetical protein
VAPPGQFLQNLIIVTLLHFLEIKKASRQGARGFIFAVPPLFGYATIFGRYGPETGIYPEI